MMMMTVEWRMPTFLEAEVISRMYGYIITDQPLRDQSGKMAPEKCLLETLPNLLITLILNRSLG